MPDEEDRNARYAEILRRIEQKKVQKKFAPIQSLLAAALDALNAAGLLEAIKRRPPPGMSAYGPKTVSGERPADEHFPAEQWVGTVMWYKPKGYQYYQTLHLLGIWAMGSSKHIRIIIGEKMLNFDAPVFNPESFYHHIKRRFDLYFDGDASPPMVEQTGIILLETPYEEAKRLDTRSMLERRMREWVKAYKPIIPDTDAE